MKKIFLTKTPITNTGLIISKIWMTSSQQYNTHTRILSQCFTPSESSNSFIFICYYHKLLNHRHIPSFLIAAVDRTHRALQTLPIGHLFRLLHTLINSMARW